MTPCKIWTGAKTRDGYGQVFRDGSSKRLHRIAYCEAHGLTLNDIKGKVVLHACDTPACYNPDHLSIGTQRDNVRDCINKGRFRRVDGIHNPRAKLTPELGAEIRQAYSTGISYTELARRYSVSKSTIARVIKQGLWND